MNTSNSYKPVRKAVFPVAGLGTRFLPATKVMPKEMLTLVDKPLIQHAVEEARNAGIEEFIFVTGRGKSVLVDHFDFQPELVETLEKRSKKTELDIVKDSDIASGKLATTRQAKPLGLGHAVWCARDLVGDEPFAVILVDDVVLHNKGCMSQMVESYDALGGNIVAVEDVPRDMTHKYGILDLKSDDGRHVDIKGMVEKPAPDDAPSTCSIIGRYILQPDIFGLLGQHQIGAGGEIQLTDAMAALIGKQPFHGLRFAGKRYDCGNKAGFIEANIAYGMADPTLGNDIQNIVKHYAETLGNDEVKNAV